VTITAAISPVVKYHGLARRHWHRLVSWCGRRL